MSARGLCSFHLGGMYLGIEAVKVQEIIRHQAITRIPLADPAIAGLINLRGQIVVAIDLRRRLGLDPRLGGRPPMNVVVRTPSGAFSLLVDRIGDVTEIDDALRDRAPATVPRAVRELIVGAYQLPDHLLLELDTDRAVEDAREGEGALGS